MVRGTPSRPLLHAVLSGAASLRLSSTGSNDLCPTACQGLERPCERLLPPVTSKGFVSYLGT